MFDVIAFTMGSATGLLVLLLLDMFKKDGDGGKRIKVAPRIEP